MEFQVTEKSNYSVVRVKGRLNRTAVYSVRRLVAPLFLRNRNGIALDMGGVPEEKELIYQVGFLNAFRKEAALAGAELRICSLRQKIKEYVVENRMDEFFYVFDNLESAENSLKNNSGRQLQ